MRLGSDMQAGGKMLTSVSVNCQVVYLIRDLSSARVLCLLPESGLECGLLHQLEHLDGGGNLKIKKPTKIT